MSCSNNTSSTGGCGCTSTTTTSTTTPPCAPPCASAVAGNCIEYMNAACVVMNDSIKEYSIKKGDTVESVIQKLILGITNPTCVSSGGTSYSPIGLQSTNITNSTVTVAWSAVTQANSSGLPIYRVEYKVSDPSVTLWTQLPDQNTTVATITGLLSMQSYEVRVKSIYPNGSNTCSSVTIIVTTV